MKLQDGHRSGKAEDSGFSRQAPDGFYLSTGDKKIGNLSLPELKRLFVLLDQLPERLATAQQQTEMEEEEIVMQEDTIVCEDEATATFYSIYSDTCEIQMTTYPQIQKMAETLQSFLDRCRKFKGPEKQVSPDPDYPIQIWKTPPGQPEAPLFPEAIYFNRRTTLSAGQQELITHYRFSINEQCSDWLTAAQLLTLHRQLKAFLKDHP